MRDDVRTYGDFKGLSPEAFEKIKDLIPFDQVVYRDNTLKVDYEGKYIDVEDFLDAICPLLDDNGWGGVDFIDHVDWEVIRYVVKKGSWTAEKIRPDNVLEPLGNEAGS